MNLRAYSGQALRWLAATAAAALNDVSTDLAGRQLHNRRNGVSGAGGVVGHAGRHRSLDLHRGSLRHLL